MTLNTYEEMYDILQEIERLTLMAYYENSDPLSAIERIRGFCEGLRWSIDNECKVISDIPDVSGDVRW